MPYVFTEQGVAMLSSVLNSERAIEVNIAIMRVFVRLREMMATQKELAFKLIELEERLEGHDEQIQNIFEAIRQLMTQPEPARKKIGFVNEPAAKYGRRKSGGSKRQICDGNLQYDVCTLRARFTLKLSVTRSRMQAMKYSRGGFA